MILCKINYKKRLLKIAIHGTNGIKIEYACSYVSVRIK